MAVNYTKVFTVIGSVVDKVRDYYAHIATYNSDQAALEAILAAQTLVRLENNLVSTYDTFRQDVSNEVSQLVNRVTDVLTDDTLIGQNFSFGQNPNLAVVWPALIADMLANSHTVVANAATVGSPSYITTNPLHGVLETGLILDGITPPIDGAPFVLAYQGLTSQLTPTAETITYTCTSDSESGTQRGSETFQITGTGAGAGGFSPQGENIGNLGSISVVDNLVGQYLSNASLDSWSSGTPSGWDLVDGVPATDFIQGTHTLTGSGSSLETQQNNGNFHFKQSLNSSTFLRNKSYWFSVWARKVLNTMSNQAMLLTILDDSGTFQQDLIFTPTGTDWQHFSRQISLPIQIVGDLRVILTTNTGSLNAGNDEVAIDQIIIAPCEYHFGVATAVFGGPDKFLIGDTITVAVSNSDAGKFQTFFRQAYGIQLPSSGSPTISDSLVT